MSNVSSETVVRNDNVAVMGKEMQAATPHEQKRLRRLKRDEEELARLEKQREESLKSTEVGDAENESEEVDSENIDAVGTSELVSEESEEGEPSEERAEKSSEKENSRTSEETISLKRYKDLQRQFTKVTQELKELKSKKEEKSVSNVTEKDVKDWIEKYPSIAGIFHKIAEDTALKSNQELREQMEKLGEIRQEVLLQKAESEIAQVHPDFDKIRDSEAFHAWVEKKPAWVAKTLYEDLEDTDTIVDIISMYKNSTSYNPPKKKNSISDRDKNAAKSVNSGGQQAVKPKEKEKKWLFKESDIRNMSIREFEQKEAEIDEARRAGKVLYDVSGAMM